MTTSTHPWQTDPMNELDDASEAVGRLDEAMNQGLEPIDRNSVELAVVNAEYRQPWDIQPNENEFQYRMFLRYRDLGLGRTVVAVYRYFKKHPEEIHNPKVTVSENYLYTLSTKNAWKERAYKWDQDQELQYQLARSEAIREMVDRHEDAISEAIDGLMTPIKALTHRIETDPEFIENLSQASAAKLVDMAGKASRTIPSLMNAERLARGMPTEIVGGVVEHQVVNTVDRDQIGEILEVLERARVLDVGDGSLGSGEIVDAEVVDVHPLPPDGDDG